MSSRPMKIARRALSSLASSPGVRKEIADEIGLFCEWRQDFHRNPELGFEEVRTSGLVAERLKSFGVDQVTTGVGVTGVVGTIQGRGKGTTTDTSISAIGLRADMDCLPMQEANELPYKSQFDGKMHACGHDGHTTMLLAAAKYLAKTRNFAGKVQLIFQPAEEGKFGGQKMVEDGLFDRFPCDEVYGMHNWPGAPAGKFVIKSGPLMASTDTINITITGKGGHGAMPHLCVDPIVIGTQLVNAFQSIVSRSSDPTDSVVVSITQFHAGSAHNVIPETATLQGTVRTFTDESRARVKKQISQITDQFTSAMGGSASIEYSSGYPATINDVDQTSRAEAAASAVVGVENVVKDFPPSMGGEDFSYMLHERPGCYAWLGVDGATQSASLHQVQYDFNDDVIPVGASWFVEMVESRMPLEASN